ncbi:heat stress transcription factor B-3-like [Solanum pennellii]|uniref:Heat stress transcription factor B-3-like n=1 Tax=Solanum pennellii TaxID=28526 RepID=A0ABM1G3H6_SOLPN|nr:heat stress transcription factor B-3-like [Solanum pennellii]
METEGGKGKGKMTEIDDIVEALGESYEGLEDVHIDISMLEYDDDDDDDNQCDNRSNEVNHGNAAAATPRELFSSSSNRRNFQRRASPFVLKIYEMLADIQFKSLISWSNNGTSFIIHDNHKFAVDVLPRFFRHNNISSFVCQLNSYGFKKVSWDKFEFQHDCFQRGKGQWLRNIKRKISKSQMNEQSTERQAIDETVAFTMEKAIEEIRAEQVTMREEIMMLQRQLDVLEKEMEDINEAGNNMSSKKAKICMILFNSLFACTRGLDSTEVAEEQGGEVEDGVENSGKGNRGKKRKMQVVEELEGVNEGRKKGNPGKERKMQVIEELEGDNEGRKKIADAADFKTGSYLGRMLMDEMNLNNLAQEQPDNFLESEELAGSSTFWTDHVEKMDHKAICGVDPALSQSQEIPL